MQFFTKATPIDSKCHIKKLKSRLSMKASFHMNGGVDTHTHAYTHADFPDTRNQTPRYK